MKRCEIVPNQIALSPPLQASAVSAHFSRTQLKMLLAVPLKWCSPEPRRLAEAVARLL